MQVPGMKHLIVVFALICVSVQSESLCNVCNCTDAEVTCRSLGDADSLLAYDGAGVVRLNVTRSALGRLRKEHLSKFHDAESVVISSNNVSVDSSSLSSLTEVRSLDLDRDSIETLAPGTFECQGKLLRLSLNGNVLRELASGSLRGLGALRELLLADNRIARVDAGALEALPSLQALDLRGNRLRALSAHALAPARALTRLDLRRNPLEALVAAALLEALPQLDMLLEEPPRGSASTAAEGSDATSAASEKTSVSAPANSSTAAVSTSERVGDAQMAGQPDIRDDPDSSSAQDSASAPPATGDDSANAPDGTPPSADSSVELDPAAVVAFAEGVEMADALLQIANGDDEDDGEDGGATLDPAQAVALAEGLAMADALLQIANGDGDEEGGDGATLDPAQAVALAEGVAMAGALADAAVWRSALEADAPPPRADVLPPPGSPGADRVLLALLVGVAAAVMLTGTAAALVLYRRLRASVADEHSLNVYVLVDDSVDQVAATECPPSPTSVRSVSYTFPQDEDVSLS